MTPRFWKAIERVGVLVGIWAAVTAGVASCTIVTTVVVQNVFDIDLALLERAAEKYLAGG